MQEYGLVMIHHRCDEDREREERTGEIQRLQGMDSVLGGAIVNMDKMMSL